MTNLLKIFTTFILLTLCIPAIAQSWNKPEVDSYNILPFNEKPPLKKWVLKSFLSPHWGHKQINTFNNLQNLANGKTQLGQADRLLAQKIKTKKRKTAGIIGSLLVVGGFMKLTSMKNYRIAQQKHDEGNIELMQKFYDASIRENKTALVFIGTAFLVDLGNVISVFSKGNKKMKDYHRKIKPKAKMH